jgi:6-phosphogluconolactonase
MALPGSSVLWCCSLAVLLLPMAAVADPPAAAPERLWVYVGTYTQRGSKGIYRCELDLASGKLTEPALAGEVKDPSFLAIAPDHRHLYAVSEIGNLGGKKTGGVVALAIDPKTGDLTRLNEQPSEGAGPCHLVTDRAGRYVLVANYGAGSAAALPIESGGRLGPATSAVQHKGSSVNKQRQEAPHAHSINLDAANRYAVVADLGLDKVIVYRFAGGKLTPNDPPSASVAPGSGPRHFAFHPDGRHAYVINELANTVTAFAYDPDAGSLKEIQVISTLPEGSRGTSYTAEVQVHPSGKFLYGSNRGHNSIAVFAIDGDGKLTAAGHEPTQGKTPRNFGIDPTGRYLLAANQDSDSIVVYRIDAKTGALKPTGAKVSVPMPVCVKFMPPPRP